MTSAIQIAGIAVGGAAGALARFWFANGVYAVLGRGFPWGTLLVNVSGSLVMGLCYALLVERLVAAPEWRALIMVGFLGAFTTFSTFSIETLNLLESGDIAKAVMNTAASMLLCLMASWLGVVAGRAL